MSTASAARPSLQGNYAGVTACSAGLRAKEG